jgi:hypothetical protein
VLAACGGSSKAKTTSNTAPSTEPPTVDTTHLVLNTGLAPWPLPADERAWVTAAGLPLYKLEQLFYHVHAHLDVFVDGQSIVVPAGLGTTSELRRILYQGHPLVYAPTKPCKEGCIAPLHTHDDSGVLHTENDKRRSNNLGEVFTEWGVRFTADCIGGYCQITKPWFVVVEGQRFSGDPRTIELRNLEEIAVVIGKPPASIPSKFPGS